MSNYEREQFLELESQVKADKASHEELRKFRYSRETVERMNSAIIDNTNAVVGQHDQLWILGDIHFGKVERLRELMSRIVCRDIHWIWGNHDKKYRRTMQSNENFYRQFIEDVLSGNKPPDEAQRIWKKQKQLERNQRILRTIFRSFDVKTVINWQDQKIMVSHTAHAVWEGSHRGAWHCYGHSHGNFEQFREDHFPEGKMVDVGIDYRAKRNYGYTPWSFEELQDFMNERSGQAVDHHK
jgi:calcineurin-like phosphoesterase family protein